LRLGAKIFGVLAGILVLYLAVGLLLPGTWEAEEDIRLPFPPAAVFPYLERVDQWRQWTPMPQSGVTELGPEAGPGAGLQWDDPQYGKGRMEILAVQGDTLVEYRVAVEDGTLQIRGSLRLRSRERGSQLVWRETGDFGWNPLLGYAARSMARSQGSAMRSSLERLRSLIEEAHGRPRSREPAPPDSQPSL
jgi:uncharacterized protein YndB with AHSA1/START domain